LLLGPRAPDSGPSTAALHQVKASLLDPSSSKQVISLLHDLPASESKSPSKLVEVAPTAPTAPIRVICLDCNDEEANEKWFSKLPLSTVPTRAGAQDFTVPSVADADVKSLESFFKKVQIVNLVQAPDLGIGQPTDGKGILAGCIPTARAISLGLSKASEQLIGLGFASTAAVWPSHAGKPQLWI
jgi:hypothetical protein